MRHFASLLMTLWAFPDTAKAAQEERCTELGGNCLCSNRLDAEGWTKVAGTDWAYDSTTAVTAADKPCSSSGGKHRIVIQPQTAPSVVPGLKGHLAMRDNSKGSYITAVPLSAEQASAVSGLVAGRYYFTLSDDWESTGDGNCTNDKYIQFATPYLTTGGGGLWADNGGSNLSAPGVHDCKGGNWCRIEMQVNFQTGLKTYFIKNVTKNTPERSWTNASPSNGAKDIMHPLHKFRDFYPHAGGCAGTAIYMFVMAAHWTSPTGNERIGAAKELEGTGSAQRAPSHLYRAYDSVT